MTLTPLEPCPTCGALPCDWVNNPHLQAAVERAQIVAWLRKTGSAQRSDYIWQHIADAIESGDHTQQPN